ncbi:hypothetical protein [Streptomyces botrytidirepellens]|uniref:Uncharacterized protein n=1 Tax=Streptomyces botrytidirepellens TaxID=2486417 RepID=A0A3M8WKC8_9ACTN|nr:hypothetical protein [Streptomyces botrytidirepellens]RNG30426.1 hypothetical protein EEJ42_10585 [Streptomyces botrytidirepellens]
MPAKALFQASGWRGREVEIPRSERGPALLEFKGGLTTSFKVLALHRSATRKTYGEELLYSYGPKALRALLPAQYNRVEVQRVKPRPTSGTGFSRWRLRTLEVADLAGLEDVLSGEHETLVYFADRARVSFAWLGDTEHGELHFTPEYGNEARQLSRHGDIRGTVTVPGAGFLAVRTFGKWTLEKR